MWKLKYAGDHRDDTPRASDGSVLSAVAAMDALDGRGLDFTLELQLQPELLLRELNKATAAFKPTDAEAAELWTSVATGNWGCGVFGGMVELKAVLQWMACSHVGRGMIYFPFDATLGPRLKALAARLVSANVTVGQMWLGLLELASDSNVVATLQANGGQGILEALERILSPSTAEEQAGTAQ